MVRECAAVLARSFRVFSVISILVLSLSDVGHTDTHAPFSLVETEELLTSCASLFATIDGLLELNDEFEAIPLLEEFSRLECGSVTLLSIESDTEHGRNSNWYDDIRGDLPRTVTRKARICLSSSVCITVQVTIYYYQCGENLCFRTTRIRRKCGLFCWREIHIPPNLAEPTVIYLSDDEEWLCLTRPRIDDPDRQIRYCMNRDRQCITQGWTIRCYSPSGRPQTVPQSHPPIPNDFR